MLGIAQDIIATVTGRAEFAPVDERARRWGRFIPLVAAAADLLLYLLCRLRILENVFLEQACVTAFFAVVVTALVTPLSMRFAHAVGAVDKGGGRRIHTGDIPRLGGIGVFAGVYASFLATRSLNTPGGVLLFGALPVFAISLFDDIVGVSATLRLAVQVGASIILILGGIRISILPPGIWGDFAEYIVTIVWLIGMANAVNFLDGMNGLVPGLSAICSGVFVILALRTGQHSLAFAAVALMAAHTAFLGFNVKPARTFLGDCGSVTTGFYLAGLGIIGHWSPHEVWVSGLVPVLVLSVPIYDMIFITVNRVLTGRVNNVREWIEYVGRDHIHHRLNALGLTRPQTVMVIWFLNTVVALSAVVLIEAGSLPSVGILIAVQVVCIFLVIALFEFLTEHPQRGLM